MSDLVTDRVGVIPINPNDNEEFRKINGPSLADHNLCINELKKLHQTQLDKLQESVLVSVPLGLGGDNHALIGSKPIRS